MSVFEIIKKKVEAILHLDKIVGIILKKKYIKKAARSEARRQGLLVSGHLRLLKKSHPTTLLSHKRVLLVKGKCSFDHTCLDSSPLFNLDRKK